VKLLVVTVNIALAVVAMLTRFFLSLYVFLLRFFLSLYHSLPSASSWSSIDIVDEAGQRIAHVT